MYLFLPSAFSSQPLPCCLLSFARQPACSPCASPVAQPLLYRSGAARAARLTATSQHSAAGKKNIDDVSLGTALSNCWKCWKLTLLASVLQFIFALTRTKSSLFFLHSFFYRLKQCSPAMRPLFKISFSEAVLAFFFFFPPFFPCRSFILF